MVLSYTSFGYSDVELSKTQLSGNDQLTSITLTNNGKYDGNGRVQIYIRDMVGSVTSGKRAEKVSKVFLKAGESKKCFTITPEDLKFYNSN